MTPYLTPLQQPIPEGVDAQGLLSGRTRRARVTHTPAVVPVVSPTVPHSLATGGRNHQRQRKEFTIKLTIQSPLQQDCRHIILHRHS